MLLHISKEKRSTHSWIICTTKRNKNGSKVNLLSQCQWYLSCLQRTEYISFRFLLYLPACTPSAAAEKQFCTYEIVFKFLLESVGIYFSVTYLNPFQIIGNTTWASVCDLDPFLWFQLEMISNKVRRNRGRYMISKGVKTVRKLTLLLDTALFFLRACFFLTSCLMKRAR